MNINLNTVVADLIAKPRTKNKEVLYTRTDGLMEQGDNTSTKASAAYIEKSKVTANSPNNLRRLFITHEAVHVQYHRLPKVGGTTTLFKTYKYNDPDKKNDHLIGDTTIREIIANNYGLRGCMGGFVQQCHLQQGIPLKDIPVVNGFGLAALAKPWVYSNIEEVYIDWLPFMSSLYSGSCDISLLLSKYGGDLGNHTILPNLLQAMFFESCGIKDMQTLRSKYPRLHTVAFIFNLEQLVSEDARNKVFFYDKEDRVKRETSWLNQLRERGLISQNLTSSTHAEWRIVPNASWMLKYTTRDGIYVFDRDVLHTYFESLKADYESLHRVNKPENKSVTSKEVNPVVQECARILLQTREKFGDVEFGIALKYLLSESVLDKTELAQLFELEDFKKYVN